MNPPLSAMSRHVQRSQQGRRSLRAPAENLWKRRRRALSVERLEDRMAPATFLVTSTLDDGSSGTMRWAINQANADTDATSTINFDIASSGVQTIQVGSSSAFMGQALPTLTHPTIIDGTSEPGYAGSPLIVLNGALAGSGVSGLTINGANSTVKGLVINQFPEDGIDVLGSGAVGDVIQGNYIGTDNSGTLALGNKGNGVFGFNASNLTIGGTSAGAGNVIAANHTGGGDELILQGVQGAVIQGNYVGVDHTGNSSLLPERPGIDIEVSDNSSNVLIGGTTPGAGNVVGFEDGLVYIHGAATHNNTVQGNSLGVGADGTSALPSHVGVWLTGGTHNNLIGGDVAGAGNKIANCNGPGVEFDQDNLPSLTNSDSILGNSIYNNAGGGIILGSGANDNQAAPVLTGLSGTATSAAISGSLSSVANTTFRIEFFANPLPSNLANTEGQTLLGAVYVTTNASGKATFTASGLAAIPASANYLTATATVATPSGTSYTYGDSSHFSSYLHVAYLFGGFQAPLSEGLNFALNRVIPIKFTLTDLTGAVVTSLAAISSLQVAPVNTDGSLGTPFTPSSPGNTGLSLQGSTYALNWQTKGLAAGNYAIVLTLADGTVQTTVISLAKGGNSAGLTTAAAGGTGTAPGGLLGGDIDLYVDNTNGDLTADELARIQNAVTAVGAVTAAYGVAVTEVTDSTLADVTLNMDTTSAVGGYADGVLGCTTDAGQITIINGWNFYAGSDGTQIGSAQYDFETVVTHELGHALGLGHSTNSTSVMYATLNTGAVNRTLTTADLNVPDSDKTGACGLHAAVSVGQVSNQSSDDGQEVIFAMLTADPARNVLSSGNGEHFRYDSAARDAIFSNGLASGPAGQAMSFAANFGQKTSDPIFAGQQPTENDDEALYDGPLLPDPGHDQKSDGTQPDGSNAPPADQGTDYLPADLAFVA